MPTPTFRTPIDYDAKRMALVQAVAASTGLPQGQVVMMQAETMGFPRPNAPYVGMLVTSASVKYGYDYDEGVIDAAGEATGLFNYTGNRSMSVGFDAFGKTHEDAYGIMAAIQAALESPPVELILDAAGMAVWDIGPVTDISALLATSYEGRSHMDVTFGMLSIATYDAGLISNVPFGGQVVLDGQNIVTLPTLTVPST
jgi:hypothetical protein